MPFPPVLPDARAGNRGQDVAMAGVGYVFSACHIEALLRQRQRMRSARRDRARRAGVGGNPSQIQNATCVMYLSCRRARSHAPKSRMRYAPPPHRCFTISYEIVKQRWGGGANRIRLFGAWDRARRQERYITQVAFWIWDGFPPTPALRARSRRAERIR